MLRVQNSPFSLFPRKIGSLDSKHPFYGAIGNGRNLNSYSALRSQPQKTEMILKKGVLEYNFLATLTVRRCAPFSFPILGILTPAGGQRVRKLRVIQCVFIRSFKKGLVDGGGWHKEILPMPEIQASFLQTFSWWTFRPRKKIFSPPPPKFSNLPQKKIKNIRNVHQVFLPPPMRRRGAQCWGPFFGCILGPADR